MTVLIAPAAAPRGVGIFQEGSAQIRSARADSDSVAAYDQKNGRSVGLPRAWQAGAATVWAPAVTWGPPVIADPFIVQSASVPDRRGPPLKLSLKSNN
jgi:hypothetical protein